jgi:hypothetical protein
MVGKIGKKVFRECAIIVFLNEYNKVLSFISASPKETVAHINHSGKSGQLQPFEVSESRL